MLIISSICQSVRFIEILLWGSTLVRFLAEIKQTPMTSLYFVNRNNVKSTRSGLMIENEMSTNCYFCEVWIWSYQKVSTVKVVHYS